MQLYDILDLGVIDITGPIQKKRGTIQLKCKISSRGYKIGMLEDNNYYVEKLSNVFLDENGKLDRHKMIGTSDFKSGTLPQLLEYVYEDAKKHIARKKSDMLSSLTNLIHASNNEDEDTLLALQLANKLVSNKYSKEVYRQIQELLK